MAIEDQTSAAPIPTPTATTAATTSAPVRSRLRGNLGVASIVFMVVAAASPLGVIGGPVPLGIAIGNGTGFPFTFVIATVVLLLFAVGFTTMTPYVKSAGAFYSYVDRSLGRAAGLGTGFAALLSYITLEAAVFGLIGPGVQSLLGSYGVPSIPWWIYAAVAFGVVVFLGYRNIELSGRVLAVLLVAEVLIVLVLDAVIVFGGNTPEGLSTGIVSPSAILSGAPGIGILFAILSFIGFEATAVFRDEARDPDRTIPRATYLSLILIGVFYAVSSWALISAVGDSKAVKTATDHGGTLLADVTQKYLGTVGEHIIQVLFVTSLFACILSFHNIVSRYVFTLSGRAALPQRLGHAHARLGSPHRASVATGVVVGVLLLAGVVTGLDPINQFYTWLAGFSSVGIVLLLGITSVAVLVFFGRNRGTGVSLWRRAIAPALGLAGLLLFLVLILQNLPTLVGGSVPLAVGIVVLLLAAFALGPVVARVRAHAGVAPEDAAVDDAQD
ncbi:APC family permease [Leifsonia shinshuensis]|uniref:Amino acid transporter n=1 Tax=Leifsonia shinshuensis TaxID=150026 RepID=A0A853CPE9_9MICO|nr:APC family permease [Leifsonia shinshuensis]NYJ22537.1 amino acid transporter [Leifsonia shinshuensis]